MTSPARFAPVAPAGHEGLIYSWKIEHLNKGVVWKLIDSTKEAMAKPGPWEQKIGYLLGMAIALAVMGPIGAAVILLTVGFMLGFMALFGTVGPILSGMCLGGTVGVVVASLQLLFACVMGVVAFRRWLKGAESEHRRSLVFGYRMGAGALLLGSVAYLASSESFILHNGFSGPIESSWDWWLFFMSHLLNLVFLGIPGFFGLAPAIAPTTWYASAAVGLFRVVSLAAGVGGLWTLLTSSWLIKPRETVYVGTAEELARHLVKDYPYLKRDRVYLVQPGDGPVEAVDTRTLRVTATGKCVPLAATEWPRADAWHPVLEAAGEKERKDASSDL